MATGSASTTERVSALIAEIEAGAYARGKRTMTRRLQNRAGKKAGERSV